MALQPTLMVYRRLFGLALFALGGCAGGDGGSSAEEAPTAAALSVSAGADQAVTERSPVTLAGSITGAADEMVMTWTQLSGPAVELVNDQQLTTTFTAPSTRREEAAVFKLAVTTATSAEIADEVTVTIQDAGNGPDGPSPQGIPSDGRQRRDRARNGREGRRLLAAREVRNYDGSENNRANPSWGATFVQLQRLAPAAYADAVEDLSGPNRPSARVVSNQMAAQAPGERLPNEFGTTDFLWQWGQFIDHDLDLTDGAEESVPIAVPAGDPWFDPAGLGTVEIPFSRALFDPASGTGPDNPRQQENEITGWIDGSMVYGTSIERVNTLRVGADSPLLATSTGDLLPLNAQGLTNANGPVPTPEVMFLAGDIRANEQVGLAVMHTLFVREHNRVATALADENRDASADEVFEATRRIVIAEIQKITFEEWLPALLGADAVGAYEGYDDTLNPSIYNAFSVAAFRLGHSMLNEQMLRLDALGASIAEGPLSLAAAFFSAPRLLRQRNDLDPILRGLASQRHQTIDTKVVSDVRNFLFGAPGDGGLDLVSLNIQRGRDHGVPDYNTMRVALGLERRSGFAEITSDAAVVAALEATYSSVDDVDLWVGGLAEEPEAGAQLGELFRTIVVRQFQELRDGDRFWYEADLNPDERERIAGVTLSSIIRANTGIGEELQSDVFRLP